MRTTHPIAILDERRDTVIDRYWFAFVCLYLRKIYSSAIYLKVNLYDMEPHEKKVYSARMEQQPTQMELQVQFWHIHVPIRRPCRPASPAASTVVRGFVWSNLEPL